VSNPAGDERSRLLRALALSRRFHLFLAYEESPRAADQLVRELEAELPRLRKQPVTLVRLDPYAARTSDAPLGDGELIDRVLVPLLSPPPEYLAHGVVHVVDASRARSSDAEAWGLLFARWNEKRNALQQLGGEVLVLLPEELKRMFATAAPDVWSIRSGEYTIEERPWLESMVAHVPWKGALRDALLWYRAIPPLALFGGDLLVNPLLQDIVLGADVGDITAEPASRGVTPYVSAVVQREVRHAEHALGQRRFDEAAAMLRRVLEMTQEDLSGEGHLRAMTAFLVALAAEGREEEALSLAAVGFEEMMTSLTARSVERLLRAVVYVHWCAGRFSDAASIDAGRIAWAESVEEDQSQMLRLIERGKLVAAKDLSTRIFRASAMKPFELSNSWLIRIDYSFLINEPRDVKVPPWKSFRFDKSSDSLASRMRGDLLSALVGLARGDESGAIRASERQLPELGRTKEPETVPRVLAFHAVVSGALQVDREDAIGAAQWFTRARTLITEWGMTGLDRRSLHRASLAVDLAHAAVDPAPPDPIAVARQLVQRASTLLGPTGEDFIARVLAVQAARELARRLVGHADAEAGEATRSALTLARPLAGHGVPAWDTIVATTEREASALPVP
jgi:hypothetical protein